MITIFEKSSTMMKFSLSGIWKQHYLLLGIHARNSNMKILKVFRCQYDRFIFILLKTKHPVDMMVWDAHWWCWHYASVHLLTQLQVQHAGLCQVLGEDRTVLNLKGGFWKTLRPAKELHHAKQAGETSLSCKKISITASTIWASNFPDCYLFVHYYSWGVLEWKINKTLCNTKKLKAKIMVAFTNFVKRTIGNTYRRFQSCLETMVAANSNFFE